MKSRNNYVGLSVYSTVFEILEYFFYNDCYPISSDGCIRTKIKSVNQ